MPSDPLGGPIVLLICFLLAEAWVSAALGAVRGLNESRLRREAEDGDAVAQALLPLAEQADDCRLALKCCATLLELACAGLTAVYLMPPVRAWLSGLGWGLSAGGATALALLFTLLMLGLALTCLCGVLPRQVAENHPEETARRWSRLISAVKALFRPMAWLSRAVSGGLLRLVGFRPAADAEVTEEDIRDMVDMGSESGTIEQNEREMIENIFKFTDHTAEDVMTHRTDVTALWVGDDRDTVVSTILETGFSRFPVYDADMDDIVGILNTRDYLLEGHKPSPQPLRALLREAYFVPETVRADDLFRDMQRRKVHMAVVVDEYGGMSGIVTMEDLLEEIVGDIYDEFDEAEAAQITKIGDDLWRIEGAAPLEDVAEALDVDLPTDEDYDTLGGLIFSQFTTIPQDGSRPVLDVCGLHIQVEAIADHRVERALVAHCKE